MVKTDIKLMSVGNFRESDMVSVRDALRGF